MSGVISQAIMSGSRFKLPLSMEKGGGMATKGLLVSADDQIRYESVQSYLQREISLLELASVLKLTERQTYRVVAILNKQGVPNA